MVACCCGSPLFPDCRLYTDSILTTALYGQCRFVQEDDVRKPKVKNWTKFAPCCLCCGRYCGRALCAQFWRQLREMQHRTPLGPWQCSRQSMSTRKVQDRNGCMQSRQRFLHQQGDVPVQYQSTAPQGRCVKGGGTKQIVLSLSKQYTDKQGWEAAELAPRVARAVPEHSLGSSRTGAASARRAPSDAHCGTRRIASCGKIASSSYEGALRASGTDGVMTRPFCTTEEGKTLFRSVPILLDFSMDGALRKTSWVAARAFGVVTTLLGLAVRVKTPDFEEIASLVQPEKYNKFLGEMWDVSGLPLSWDPML